jgi:protein-disulfide isomerase
MSRRERRAKARYERPAGDARRARQQPVPRPFWKSPVIIVSAAAVLLAIAIIAISRPPQPADTAELITPPTSYPAGIARGEVLGAADAPVAIQLYSDFQCPACRLFVTAQLPRLLTDFVGPGTLRIEARDIAFLGQGTPDESLELAVGATCAAEQERYWPFHDLVFWNQGRENQEDHDAAFIARIADAAGVDRVAWDACIARSDVRSTITAQTATALGGGVNSTPTLLVNGQAIKGVPDYDQLAALIRQLAAAASPPPPTSPSAAPS